jgi:RNA polymerase sigma factor (sigma-70 family)
MQPHPDDELLAAWSAGNQEALGVLVARYHGLVRATCRRQAPRDEIDDCVQAVFLVLVRRPRAAARAPTLSAWLLRVAWNVCRSARRRAMRRRAAEQRAAVPDATTAPGGNEALDHLDSCLLRLPSRQRDAVSLRYLAGHDTDEVAAALGTSRDNAYQLLSRGLEQLRSLMARRGVSLPAAALGSLLLAEADAASAPMPVASLTSLVSGTSSPAAVALAESVGVAMTPAGIATLVAAAGLALASILAVAALAMGDAWRPAAVGEQASSSTGVDEPPLVVVPPRAADIGQPEADAESANRWLPDVRKRAYTPVGIGWPAHGRTSRFNVLQDGTILGPTRPCLVFSPTSDDGFHYQLPVDQGWSDHPTPVIRTTWIHEGIEWTSDFFAHQPGGGEAVGGDEPLVGWVRLSVRALDGRPRAARCGFAIRVISRTAPITPQPLTPLPADGWQLLAADASVVLGMPGGQDLRFAISPAEPGDPAFPDLMNASHDPDWQGGRWGSASDERQGTLVIELEARPGAHADLFYPLPLAGDQREDASRIGGSGSSDARGHGQVERDVSLGFDGALRESDAFWSLAPATAASIETPEPWLNDAIRNSLRIAAMNTVRDGAAGARVMLGSSWKYPSSSPTLTALECSWFWDALGRHALAGDLLEPFTHDPAEPRADSPERQPGQLGAPGGLAAYERPTDHGCILYALCRHALITGDAAFTASHLDTIIRACACTAALRRSAHAGIPGLMPPAPTVDWTTGHQSVWADGWSYQGLVTAVRLLRKLKHPRAEEFAHEAEAYRRDIATALREAAERQPPWTDAAGASHPLLPVLFPPADQRQQADLSPLCLAALGVLAADDPLMQAAMARSRAQLGEPGSGPRREGLRAMRLRAYQYTWSAFSAHRSGDRATFLEGMYGIIAASVAPQTFAPLEAIEGGWIPGIAPGPAAAIEAARLAVIDDQIAPGELHLLRLVPRAWVQPDHQTRFERMPTEFGPVTLAFSLSHDGTTLDVRFDPAYRERPTRVHLHVPPIPGLARVILNGEALDWRPR